MDDVSGWLETRWGFTESEILRVVGNNNVVVTEEIDYNSMY